MTQERRASAPVLALAYAGGVIAYHPLLTLLLPLRVEQVAGAARFDVLEATTAAGAVTAGATNIVWGWWSDRALAQGRGRRRGVAAGMVALIAAYVALGFAGTPLGIVLAVVGFQAAVNAVLAPLVALIAEEGRGAGRVGALLAAGPPIAALLGPLLLMFAPGWRLALAVAATAICLLPMLLAPHHTEAAAPLPQAISGEARRGFAVALGARLLVQIAGSILFAYLLYIMEAFAAAGAADVPARVSRLALFGTLLPLPATVLLGRVADRHGGHPRLLAAAALTGAAGLATMAAAATWHGAAAGFCLFALGWGSFMPLQAGLVMRTLPDPAHRGRDLGVMNLANMVPVLIGQVLAWRLAAPGHVGALLAVLAGLTAAGGLATLAIRPAPAP